MKTKGPRAVPILALSVALLLTAAAVVSARPLLQGVTSEANTVELARAAGFAPAVQGPDVDGYDGPLSVGSSAGAPSEPGIAPAAAAAAQADSALQPDDNGYEGPAAIDSVPGLPSESDASPWAELLAGDATSPDSSLADPAASPDWTGFNYTFIAGSGLIPRDSGTQWSYGGFGCVSASAGSAYFTMHVDLPEGSSVDYLRLYYYDTSSSTSRAWLTTYDAAGAYLDVTSVTSAGTGGYGSALSDYVGHVVAKTSRSYVVNWSPEVVGATMRLCGLRIAYRLPS